MKEDRKHIVRGALAADAVTLIGTAGHPAVRLRMSAPAGDAPIVAQYVFATAESAQLAAEALRKGYAVQVQCTHLRVSAKQAIVAAGVTSILCGATDVTRFGAAPKHATTKRRLRKVSASAIERASE